VIACDGREINGLGNGLTLEKVTVGAEALFPLHWVFNLRCNYHLGHVISP
jgi:hypothetical protein